MSESGVRRLDIERYAAGELAGVEARTLEEHLRDCSACGAYLARLSAEKTEFLRAHPFSEFRAAAARRATAARWYTRFAGAVTSPAFRPALVPLCALALICLTAVPFAVKMGLFNAWNRPENRIKGVSSSLSYIYKRDGVVRESAPNDRFRVGDQIMIRYSSAGNQYLALVSIDRGGAVSFYHPDSLAPTCSIRSGVGSSLSYPVSIELDGAGGAELVVGIFSPSPLDTGGIQRWVARLVKVKGDLAALEREIKSTPPAPGSRVATLLLDRG